MSDQNSPMVPAPEPLPAPDGGTSSGYQPSSAVPEVPEYSTASDGAAQPSPDLDQAAGPAPGYGSLPDYGSAPGPAAYGGAPVPVPYGQVAGPPPYPGQPPVGYPPAAYPVAYGKSKVAAGLLGIFLGGLGIHNFYLGFTGKAIAQLLITVLSLGFLSIVSVIWGLVEGILILTAQPGTAHAYDANGVPLTQ